MYPAGAEEAQEHVLSSELRHVVRKALGDNLVAVRLLSESSRSYKAIQGVAMPPKGNTQHHKHHRHIAISAGKLSSRFPQILPSRRADLICPSRSELCGNLLPTRSFERGIPLRRACGWCSSPSPLTSPSVSAYLAIRRKTAAPASRSNRVSTVARSRKELLRWQSMR
jgi:hypothetical protein